MADGLMPIRLMMELNVKEWEAMIDVSLKRPEHSGGASLPAPRRRWSEGDLRFDPIGARLGA